ncbi:MAG TPA: alpha/beta hydrolase [Rhabdochlamydiaceae bacterium]|jgi:acetyl esterase/lipase|nr:alpha/beta hydrolase [Rhabdochlamydiaceae bacterium]
MDSQTEKFYQTLLAKTPKGNLSIAQIRYGFEKLMADFPAQPDVRFQLLSIGKLSAAWVHAPGCSRENIILFFHGGGYVSGSFHSHQDLIGRLAKATSCDVLAVDYRLAPEHPFPAALQDAVAAYEFLRGQLPAQNIVFAGSSAGGGLALSLLLKLLDKKEVLPRAAICISPWVDLAMTGTTLQSNEGHDLIHAENIRAAASIYLAGHNPKDPLASPLYGNLQGLPPLLIQVGTHEVFLDEIERFAQKAKESNVEVELQKFDEMIHTWHLFASMIPEGQKAFEKIGEFVQLAK